jgi:hypothetical protein
LRSRIVDRELTDRLAATGAVVVEGPKACGKTLTARQVVASEVLLDVDENARAAAAVDPALLLAGDTPRLIDEWQLEPAIWNHVATGFGYVRDDGIQVIPIGALGP